VEVYYLRRLTLIEKVRREHRLPKSSRGDIKVLMSIEERWFRRVTEDFLVMRRMILAYRSLLKTHQQLLNKYKALSEAEKEVLRPVIKSLEVQMEEMARQIAEEAGRRYPSYNGLVEVLGIGGRPSALESLVEVFTYAEWSSWCRVRNYFGLWDRDGKTHYHKTKARNALETLTLSIKGYRINGRDIEEVLKTICLNLKTRKAGIIAQA
jgi:CRISPR/Cas system CSM-associated protein Csm2 small subunit